MLGQLSGSGSVLEQQWDLEYQRHLATVAMDALKQKIETKTWMAFELTAMNGLSAAEASVQTGLSKGAVYVARSRVTAKLRTEIERLLADEEAT